MTHKGAGYERTRSACFGISATGEGGKDRAEYDAEEADRLDLSLDVIQAVLSDPSLQGWDGFGIVVQAYGKRAATVIDWFYTLAKPLIVKSWFAS